jgi:signal transduction histidine kinase
MKAGFMTIKTQFRINILVSICLVIVVGGILLYADRRIDAEMEKNWLADRISKGVFDLHTLTNSYLLYREERSKTQWNLNMTSLKRLLAAAKRDSRNAGENLEVIFERCDEMEALFEKIISYAERLDHPTSEEAGLVREAYYRLITNLTAKGQEMVSHAFLLIQESNRDLSSVKRQMISLVMISILLAMAVFGMTSYSLGGRIVASIRQLQKGIETIAGGDLGHTLDIQSDNEIGQLALAFNEMTRRLGQSEKERESYVRKLADSNRELEEFAFVASHDLQEPLRKIQTFGDRLKERHGGGLGEEGLDYLTRMQNAAVRMQALIQGLLSYSRVTSRPEPFSQVPLTPLVQEVISDLAVRVEETGGQVKVGALPVIEASPNQMRQLFQNLLGNALKFCGEERPLIKVSGRKVDPPPPEEDVTNESCVEILVKDNGIGFDEKYLDRIFLPFQRLHGRSHYEGTGMGLAICRKIVERHGGTITAKSIPGKGATFIVLLPVKQKPGEESNREIEEEGEDRTGEGRRQEEQRHETPGMGERRTEQGSRRELLLKMGRWKDKVSD